MVMLCNLQIQDLEHSTLKQSRFAKFKVDIYVRGNNVHAQMKVMVTLTNFFFEDLAKNANTFIPIHPPQNDSTQFCTSTTKTK